MIDLGSAVVALGADAAGLDNALEGAKKKTTSWASGLGSKVGLLAGGAILAGATAAVGGIAAIGAAAFDTGNAIDTAVGKAQSQLGNMMSDSIEMGEAIKSVYGNNFGDSIEDVGQAISDTMQQMDRFGTMTQEELTSATEKAIALRDAFGLEVNETTSAANTLMEEFGLSADEAFTFIQSGLQNGLNAQDDFLDTIGEYSNQFKEGGASAAEFFSFMDTGLRGGMLGTDKAADMFKEFVVRIQDGSETTRGGLEQIGISVDEFLAKLASGEMTEMEAFNEISKALKRTDDAAVQMQAGVALFGTQFEDLGASGALAIDSMALSMEDISAITGDMNAQYNNLGTIVEGLKRKAAIGLAPLGERLTDIAKRVMPFVEEGMTKFFDWIGPKIEVIAEALGGFIENLVTGEGPKLFDWLEGLRPLFESVVGAIKEWVPIIMSQLVPGLRQLATWGGQIAQVIFPILGRVIGFVTDHMNIFAPIAAAIGAVILALSSPVTLVIAAIVGLATAWANNWGGIQEKVAAVWAFLQPIFQQIGDWLAVAIPAAIETMKGFWENTLKPAIETVWTWVQENVFPIIADLIDWLQVAIPAAIETLKTFWQDTLLPAIEIVWAFIQDDLVPLFTSLWELLEVAGGVALTALQGLWENVLQPALEKVWAFIQDNVIPIFEDLWQWLSETLGPVIEDMGNNILPVLERAFDGISRAVQSVIGFIRDLIDRLRNIELPDWLTPGSPTPFETGLWGISKALRHLRNTEIPDFTSKLGNVSLAGATAAGGTTFGDIYLTMPAGAKPYQVAGAAEDGLRRGLRQRGFWQ